MSRTQYGPMLKVTKHGETEEIFQVPFGQSAEGKHYDENWLQDQMYQNPDALPFKQIDPSFGPLIPLCRELNTGAGPIDIVYINKNGMLTLVECKLWRNPEARREVVGQILDYAKEFSQWDYEDLQREVSRSLKQQGLNLYDLVKQHDEEIEEAEFIDNVARNLKEGKFLLIILGDGIRRGVEAITDFLQNHAGLNFSFGLVEAAIYHLNQDEYLIQPRVIAKTLTINRYSIMIDNPSDLDIKLLEEESFNDSEVTSSKNPSKTRKEAFDVWKKFLGNLKLDDKSQPLPNPRLNAYLIFNICSLPREVWLLIYRDKNKNQTVVQINTKKESALARQIYDTLLEEREQINLEIDADVIWKESTPYSNSPSIWVQKDFDTPLEQGNIDEQLDWLADYTNKFVNAFRHRIDEIIKELDIK